MSKPFKTVEEQIEILKSRGLIIQDEERALFFLKNNNYYELINGYKDFFIDKDKTEMYIEMMLLLKMLYHYMNLILKLGQ